MTAKATTSAATAPGNGKHEYLLRVKGLQTFFYTEEGLVKAVDGVDFDVKAGEVLGIVGESGCGKSVTSLSIMRLIQTPPGRSPVARLFSAAKIFWSCRKKRCAISAATGSR